MRDSLSGFYPVNAIVLGAWESLSATGWIPTISATVRRAHHSRPTLTKVLVYSWLVGLARHLLS